MTTEEIKARRLNKLDNVPPRYRDLFSRVVLKGGRSRKDAITAFCIECNGYEGGGRPITEVIRECVAVACPLWHLRPFQGEDNEEEK